VIARRAIYYRVLSEITASERSWNSATTLYLARALERIAQGQRLSVLDMGCGEGRTIRFLESYGHALHGVDLPDNAENLRHNLGPLFGDDFSARIRVVEDERKIPFDTAQFDIVYANQVFEHVRFLDQLLAECTRVLKPDGVLITLFPLATYPLEGHVLLPLVHWLPPGRVRRSYLRACFSLGLGRKLPGYSTADAAREWDERLRLYTFYRFMNEIESLFTYYFEEWYLETDHYVRAKIDLLHASGSAGKRTLGWILSTLQGKLFTSFVTYGFNAVFCARRPRPEHARSKVTPWRH
jgi:SAM-dependent methyltransferase